MADVCWLSVYSFQLNNLHKHFSLNKKFQPKVKLSFFLVFHFFLSAGSIWETFHFLLIQEMVVVFICDAPMGSVISVPM